MNQKSVFIIETWNRASQIWYRNWLSFKHNLKPTLFWILLEPLFYFIAIGFGLGFFVSPIQGLSYVEFFLPGLLCISCLLVPFVECTYGNFSKLTYQGTYSIMILTPIQPQDIVLGEILWGATKGMMSVAGVTLVAIVFGILKTPMVIAAFPILFLQALIFSALVFIVATFMKNYDGASYVTSGLMIPMSLFSGTYFPIAQLHWVLQIPIYLSPVTHSVGLVRGLIYGGLPVWMYPVHLIVLLVIFGFTARWAIQRFDARLIR